MAVVPLQNLDERSGVDARMEALDKLAKLVDEVADAKARHRSNVFLKREHTRQRTDYGSVNWVLLA